MSTVTDLGIATFAFKMTNEKLNELAHGSNDTEPNCCKVAVDYVEINERDRFLVLTLCNEHGMCEVKATPDSDEDFEALVERYEGGGIGGSYYLDKAICELDLEVGYVDIHV